MLNISILEETQTIKMNFYFFTLTFSFFILVINAINLKIVITKAIKIDLLPYITRILQKKPKNFSVMCEVSIRFDLKKI